MDTRRVRRLEQRRARRIAAVATSICALGLGAGLSLPRSSVVAVFLLATATVSLTIVWMRADHRARSHGLTRVVRFPAKVAIVATFDSLRSRIVGPARALRGRIAPTSVDATEESAEGAYDDECFRHFDVGATDATR